ncbi:MAG: 4-hydroxy-tetrahydrodipicolinate synthase [Eubacteriales bacterium]|nr:4-hydroxy-tetrahydrodipicolinate synthase [Eubacteriales bacterium]
MASLFEGSAVALVTPFKNGRVDTAAIERLVERQLAGGIAAIVACGTTGEPSTMTADERELTVRTVFKAVGGRVPVIAGTGTNCTQEVIDTARRYEDLGCVAQLVVTPYYNKTSQEGLYRHFMTIAENTNLPVMIYNVPSRTTIDIDPDVLARLADCEQIVALKESSYNLPLMMEKFRRVGDRLAIYSGNDDTAIPLMGLGAKGVVSVVANVLPETMSLMMRRSMTGEHEAALAIQLSLMPLIRALFVEVNPIPCKAAMEMMGLCDGEVRLPLVPMGEENRAKLRQALLDFGVQL